MINCRRRLSKDYGGRTVYKLTFFFFHKKITIADAKKKQNFYDAASAVQTIFFLVYILLVEKNIQIFFSLDKIISNI